MEKPGVVNAFYSQLTAKTVLELIDAQELRIGGASRISAQIIFQHSCRFEMHHGRPVEKSIGPPDQGFLAQIREIPEMR